MAWFGGVRSFHSTCLKSYAHSLASLPDVSVEKVKKLIAYCPGVHDSEPCVFHDRALSAVVALGLFAVETELKYHGEEVVGYLVRLLRAVTKATSRWTQNTQAAAKQDGLIAEQFCYKLCLILSNISVFCEAKLREQIQEAQIDVLKTLVQEFIGHLGQKDGKQELYMVTVPSLLGMARALQGCHVIRRQAFWAMCSPHSEPWEKGDSRWDMLRGQPELEEKYSMTLFEVTLEVMSADYLSVLEKKLEQLKAGQQLVGQGYPYHYLSQVLHCSMICLLRDTITTVKQEPSEKIRAVVYKLAEERIKSGVQELGSGGAGEKAFHVVQVMSVAVELLVWAVPDETELEASFQQLSSLLSVHTTKLNVLVSPLRAAILQGIAKLAAKSRSLVNLALSRFKEFLTSNLFYGMYSDAISGTGAGNADFPFLVMEEPKSFIKTQSSSLTPIHISRQDAFVKVLQALAKAVCCTLLAGSADDSDCMKSFLEPLGNLLYTSDTESVQSSRTAECIVMLLGQVAIAIKDQYRAMEAVVTAFQQRLFHPPSNIDGYIVIELGKIAAKTGDSTSVDELSRLMELSLGVAASTVHSKNSHDHIYQPVVNSLVYVANHLEDKEEGEKLMRKSLQLFIQQGIEAKKASDKADATHKATSSSFSLGLMLPVIATLMKHMDPMVNPKRKDVKLFRDFWLYCIVMGFSDFQIGVFPSAWYENVREIAAKSPLLLSMGAEQYLDKELELNHPLKVDNIAPGVLQEARQSLIDKLGKSQDLDRLVYRLTFVQCMYLISIYRLESLRLERNTKVFADIFKYLEDKGLLDGELWVAIEMIAKKLFSEYLDLMEAKPATRSRAEELEELAQLLLFKFNHLRGRIKKAADTYLTQLVDRFSHLLWSKKVMHTMLDLMHALSMTLLTMDQCNSTAVEVKLPYLKHSATMPDIAGKREKTVNNFAARCQQIIEVAIKWTPLETKTILEDYICGLERSSEGLNHHTAVSLAATLISKHFDLNTYSKYIPAGANAKWPECLKDTASQPLSKLYLRSRFMGEVQGMQSTLLLATLEGKQSEVEKKLSSLLVEQLKAALKNGSRERLSSAMYRATAQLISIPEVDRTLLYSLCQLPVKEFTEVAISIAVDCWQWLIVSRPDLEYQLMREFAAGWKWTVEEKLGIFSPPPPTKAKIRPPPIPVNQHSLLIKFLTERLEVIKTRDAGQVSLIVELLHQCLTLGVGPNSQHPQVLSHAPEATSARFRLLNLAVSILQDKNLINSTLERTLLREKIYNTTLDFFSYDLEWPVGDASHVREAITNLVQFWRSVKDLRTTATVGQLPTSALEASTSIPRNNNSFWQLAFTAETSAAQGTWMNVLSSGHTHKKSASLSLQVPLAASKRSSTVAKNKVLLKRKNIILALVRHEIERLDVWQNLTAQVDLNIPGVEVVTSWVNPTQSDRHWSSTIVMACHASSHLAFQLTNRFKNLDVVIREVTRLIHTNPVAFTTIPDAAQFLARKEYVVQNAPELYHLLYWRDVAPASALIFFSKPFSQHPITAQFASKAMDSFQPDEILLYIPQLVQTVRYDKLGFAKEYIVSAGNKSQLLAHQFLWNMEANKYVDEEGKQKDPEIGDILEELSDKIKANLSGAALKFYKREFSFFKKITDISGIIRPFPKHERRAECLKALKEVQLEPGVYLPSNPDSVLLEVDYKSGIPMQSAAKAPFLARFKVAKCGIMQVEDMNTKESAETLAELPERFKESSVWQGCIFKVGDDVRQDMLALQIMQLFKDVFQGVGLELFLIPYRVVATAMGCGVIECVPNSKSRDQLGKATQVSLKAYFNSRYGDDNSVLYQEARANFIKSMSAYSLVSYILQVKDRHNGNIMIDKDGHIIHIDFGFLFESSPGGNLGFEPDLKLTEEMMDVMGGKKSDWYKWFLELCVKGYLAIRPFQEQIVSLVTLMLDTGLPCFRGNTIEPLRARFHPSLSEKEAAKAINDVVETARLNFRTYSYDVLQDIQQKIYYYKKADQ